MTVDIIVAHLHAPQTLSVLRASSVVFRYLFLFRARRRRRLSLHHEKESGLPEMELQERTHSRNNRQHLTPADSSPLHQRLLASDHPGDDGGDGEN